MKKYKKLQISIKYFQDADVLTSSTVFENGDDETEKIPFGF